MNLIHDQHFKGHLESHISDPVLSSLALSTHFQDGIVYPPQEVGQLFSNLLFGETCL